MTVSDYSTARRLTTDKPACFALSSDGQPTFLRTPDSEKKLAEGGMRTQGWFKADCDDEPLITIVTVVYNGAEYLEDTIKNVIDQTYVNVEYIIVDGGSTDGTLDIIRKYDHAIDYWVSEPDKGIYDAMNKGIDLGSGAWVNFMNAGDRFYDRDNLYQVSKLLKPFNGIDIIYGDHEVRYPDKIRKFRAGQVTRLWKGSQFCHQSGIIRLSYHKKNKYNLCRNIAADFEFFYKAQKYGLNLAYFPDVLSSITPGGVSDAKRIESILEWWLIVDKSNLVNVRYSFRILSEVLKVVIKKALGK